MPSMALSRTSSSLDGSTSTTVIAIDRDKNSQYAVKWAVDNVLSKSSHCILIHVRNQSFLPLDFEEIPKEGRPPTEAELQQLFLPYRGFCARKGIEAKEVILHDIEVSSALIDYISNNSISNIVVGASNRNALTRKFRNADVPSTLLKSAPGFCAVYVISKGKVQTARQAGQPQTPTGTANFNAANSGQHSQRGLHVPNVPPNTQDLEDKNRTSLSHGSRRSVGSDRASFDRSSDSLMMTPNSHYRSSSRSDPTLSMDSFVSATSSQRNSDVSWSLSCQTNNTSVEAFDSFVSSDSPGSSGSSQTPKGLEVEMKRLKHELMQTMEMYNTACREAIVAQKRARELQQLKSAEERKLEQAKLAEEAALALAEVEKQKSKAATEAAEMAQRLADMEVQRRMNAELRARQESEERMKAMDALAHGIFKYRIYTIEEIEAATDDFRNSLKIGEGGYGPVFKGVLDHTVVAIKVLRPDMPQGQKQFQQEVEVLSCIRHPNMVLLLGACPEYGCLVYEYMDNGSLEDRIFRKGNTPPIPWQIRFKIAAEISTALLFLHQTKPEPLVHRDLKPANILLTQNYLSKISDVGLARLVPPSVADSVTQYHMTAAAGTFCYIDPEYQQTGLLGVKSDIYSLGVMLLQIITAKPPMGLSHHVEDAIEKGRFAEILDPTVEDWPVQEALSLAKLALKCCELRKRDRPDLGKVILPELNRLRDIGLVHLSSNRDTIFYGPSSHYSVPEVVPTVSEDEYSDPSIETNIQHRSI
ncbi:U-box domain-containing protein 52-like isoform X1 [Quercus lobata]|uniref:U-box domain-containing protein 52-like isoform X1 n=1 Tax=Quercus lobata TaxID=97700 RepID=UPI0012488AFC|nr:U-box domain-containing protein 52-like isoform X1 [Quercus lobata]